MSELGDIARQKGYATRKRHIFLCTNGTCCKTEESLELWSHLKGRLKELEPDFEKATISRSKADCLRICQGGPIAVVYPEGTLYAGLDKAKIDRVIEEHLVKGDVVAECEIKP